MRVPSSSNFKYVMFATAYDVNISLCVHAHLQKEVDHEIEENRAEQERLQGSNLVYGEKVQVHNKERQF